MRCRTRATSTSRRPARSATTRSSACRCSSAARRSACWSCRRCGAASSRAQRGAAAARDRGAGGRHHRAGAARSRTCESKEKERREYRRRAWSTPSSGCRRTRSQIERAEPAPRAQASRRRRLTGLPAAPGFGRGRAHLLQPAVSFDAGRGPPQSTTATRRARALPARGRPSRCASSRRLKARLAARAAGDRRRRSSTRTA